MQFPSDRHRHAIYGQTGSGKTLFGMWCLSRRSFDEIPWVVIDGKRDPSLARIPRMTEIAVTDKPPKQAGLYVVRPTIHDFEDGEATALLWRIWERERCGVVIDEGYNFGMHDRGLRALLTQGRSKRIPMICLSQKPSWVCPFIHSESEYKSVFYLDMPADIDRIRSWVPQYDPEALPRHASVWRSTPERMVTTLGPCPGEEEILDAFDSRTVRRSIFSRLWG
jgi:hypothetical protein